MSRIYERWIGDAIANNRSDFLELLDSASKFVDEDDEEPPPKLICALSWCVDQLEDYSVWKQEQGSMQPLPVRTEAAAKIQHAFGPLQQVLSELEQETDGVVNETNLPKRYKPKVPGVNFRHEYFTSQSILTSRAYREFEKQLSRSSDMTPGSPRPKQAKPIFQFGQPNGGNDPRGEDIPMFEKIVHSGKGLHRSKQDFSQLEACSRNVGHICKVYDRLNNYVYVLRSPRAIPRKDLKVHEFWKGWQGTQSDDLDPNKCQIEAIATHWRWYGIDEFPEMSDRATFVYVSYLDNEAWTQLKDKYNAMYHTGCPDEWGAVSTVRKLFPDPDSRRRRCLSYSIFDRKVFEAKANYREQLHQVFRNYEPGNVEDMQRKLGVI